MVNKELEDLLMSGGVHLNLHVEIPPFSLVATTLDFNLELGWFALAQVLLQHADDLVKLDSFFAVKDFLHFAIEDDVAAVFRVLQPILFDVLPKSSDHFGSGLLLDA